MVRDDPAVGQGQVLKEEIGSHFSGIAGGGFEDLNPTGLRTDGGKEKIIPQGLVGEVGVVTESFIHQTDGGIQRALDALVSGVGLEHGVRVGVANGLQGEWQKASVAHGPGQHGASGAGGGVSNLTRLVAEGHAVFHSHAVATQMGMTERGDGERGSQRDFLLDHMVGAGF